MVRRKNVEKPFTRMQFRNRLLALMEKKDNWAWPNFTGKLITRKQLKVHFQQEYAVYVRDFPVFLSRIHGQNPPLEVRAMLAENIYEEDTGKLSLDRSHPELFLTMMKGLGYPSQVFEQTVLLPASRRYRLWLDRVSADREWTVGAAVLTIFVEGSKHDRKEIVSVPKAKTKKQIEASVMQHPLVQHHGVPFKCMDLTRAHLMVENDHRRNAYQMVVNHAVSRPQQDAILAALDKTLQLWLQYRDSIARACQLKRR